MNKRFKGAPIFVLILAMALSLTACKQSDGDKTTEVLVETMEAPEEMTKVVVETNEEPEETEEVSTSPEMEFDENIPAGMLNATDSFAVTTELVRDLPNIDDNFRVMQGGCVSEEYAWFMIVNAENYSDDYNKRCYIVQYDRETMEEVFRSEPLALGHANDLTYVAETNELYALHGHRYRISVLDADTLTIKEEIKLNEAFNCYAIEYNQDKDCFVLAMGKAGQAVFNRDWKPVQVASSQDTKLVTQGICADARYVYHVLYSTKSNTEEPDNMIYVIDWEGNLITKIPIGLEGYEPENISLVGDAFYIGCNDGAGGIVFTAKLTKE